MKDNVYLDPPARQNFMLKQKLLDSVYLPTAKDLEAERRYILKKLEKIPEAKIKKAIQSARRARKRAYIPYSHYHVGAAIITTSGKIYDGQNSEVVSYSQTRHAESHAVSHAINAGEAKKGRKFIELVIVCGSGRSGPCGACRQEIAEHCDNAVLISVYPDGSPSSVSTLNALFPLAFVPKHLGIK